MLSSVQGSKLGSIAKPHQDTSSCIKCRYNTDKVWDLVCQTWEFIAAGHGFDPGDPLTRQSMKVREGPIRAWDHDMRTAIPVAAGKCGQHVALLRLFALMGWDTASRPWMIALSR